MPWEMSAYSKIPPPFRGWEWLDSSKEQQRSSAGRNVGAAWRVVLCNVATNGFTYACKREDCSKIICLKVNAAPPAEHVCSWINKFNVPLTLTCTAVGQRAQCLAVPALMHKYL